MELSSILIPTFTFSFANIVDTVISSSDTFHWIDKISTCFNNYSFFNYADKDISINSSVNSIISILLFAWSALMIFFPFFGFTIYLCLKRCHFSNEPLRNNVHLLILFEVFIILSIFGPVTNINFWLRDCIASYVALCVSLFFHSLAIIVTMLSARQLCFQNCNTRFNFLKCFRLILQAVIITLLYGIQIVACVSTFAVFFSVIMYNVYFETVYFSFAVLASISMLIANGINRWEFCSYSIDNGQHGNKCCIYLKRVISGISTKICCQHGNKCCVYLKRVISGISTKICCQHGNKCCVYLKRVFSGISTAICCLSCIILLVLTGILYRNNERTIVIISLCFLGVSIVVSLSYLLFYFCLCYHQRDPPAESRGTGESDQDDDGPPTQSRGATEPDQEQLLPVNDTSV